MAFAVGIALNLGFVAVEALYGFLANSMALLADAGHNLSDVLGLAVAWFGAMLARRPPSRRFSYGLRAASILAALANSVILLIAVSFIAYHAVMRLIIPDLVEGGTVTIVAAIGIVINGATALMFARGRRSDLNIRGAYLHMVADALVSAGVVIAGIAHPGDRLAVGRSGGGPDRRRPDLPRRRRPVPPVADHGAGRRAAGHRSRRGRGPSPGLPGVVRIHDLHIWPMSTTEIALTAHLVIPEGFPGDAFLADCAHGIEHRFRISHSTFQVEIGGDCVRQAPHDL